MIREQREGHGGGGDQGAEVEMMTKVGVHVQCTFRNNGQKFVNTCTNVWTCMVFSLGIWVNGRGQN